MSNTDFSFSKVVSIPTISSWSQAYNAGNFFVVLSLVRSHAQNKTDDFLNTIGKNIVDTLEQEFFTLEVKNLASIKQAIAKTLESISKDISFSFAASYLVDNILYLFVSGQGKVFIKRGGKVGTVLDTGDSNNSIGSFSGFIEDGDLIILATKPFLEIVETKTLIDSLNNDSTIEIAQRLSRLVHEKEGEGAAAIIMKLAKAPSTDGAKAPRFRFNLKFDLKLSHSRKMFLTIAILVLTIFISSIFFSIKKQNDAKIKTLFTKTYQQAEKKYDEGKSLLDLNKNEARQSFIVAKKLLEDGKSHFTKGSSEEKKILELLKNVNQMLALSSEVNIVSPKTTTPQRSLILLFATEGPYEYLAQDDKNIYFIDSKAVYSVEKGKEKTNQIIKNSNLWQEAKGLGTYLGNIYILDKKTILKFIPTQDGFTKTNYLQEGISLDFSNASSMSIDGSIFILFKDGNIQKLTRGKPESFRVSRLDKAFINPSRVFTDALTNNIYILDNGNSRIVVLNKEGVYQTQYKADVLKLAKDFEVLEKDKKIYVLSQNKVYEIGLK